ncbi:unnamed protein product [Heterobilharzia americana]|nr:unnamed protein product [Heterobilharzia americana]
MSYSPTDSPSINISTSPSCGDNAGNDDDDDHDHPLEGCSNLHTTEKDPPLRSTKVRCTSVQQAKCSNFCHTNDTSLMALRCRICLEEGDEVDGLLSPCRCKGSVGLVHRNCLEKWLLTSGKANCELCGYAYILTPSYRCSSQFSSLHHLRHVSNEIRSVGNWLNWRRTRRHLIADVICMIVLTSATYTAVYFCVVGALDYAQSNPLGWKVFGLCGLAVLLIFLLSIWMISIIKYHLGDFRNYQHHLQQMALAETVQLSALPTYRFSVQPRPRGSSIVLCTLHRDHELSLIPQVHETQILSPSNKQSVDVNGSVSDDQSLTSSRSASSSNQQIVTTVSLTTVPEVTDDFFSSSSKTSYVSTTQI